MLSLLQGMVLFYTRVLLELLSVYAKAGKPALLPSHCICGSIYTVGHAMNCPSGGFPSIRHNELRDLTSAFLSEVCHNVHTEPTLQPLQGEHLKYKSANGEVGARLDVAAQNFGEKTTKLPTLMSQSYTNSKVL